MNTDALNLSEWMVGTRGRWWCDDWRGEVWPVDDTGNLWTATGSLVDLVAHGRTWSTAREAAAAALEREIVVEPYVRAIKRLLPGYNLVRVIDGNDYTANPERWHTTWEQVLETGRAVMGGDTVEDFLDRYATSITPINWQAAAADLCRTFPNLSLHIKCHEWQYDVRLRGEYTELLGYRGTEIYSYALRGTQLVLIETD